jgi:hypothetical protein
VSSPFVSWSPELNVAYEANVAAATASLQDDFGPLAALSYQSPPDSPFSHILSEASFNALVYAAQQELYSFVEQNPVAATAHIEELEHELQYPDPSDVAAQEPVWDQNADIPDLFLPPPVVYADVATVLSPAPPSWYPTPTFKRQESPAVAPAASPAVDTDPIVVKEEPPESPVLTFSPAPV